MVLWGNLMVDIWRINSRIEKDGDLRRGGDSTSGLWLN